MENNNLFTRVFTWLALGLLISFGVAYYVSNSEYLISKVFSQYFVFLVVIELALAFIMSIFIRKLSKDALRVLYILYCMASGFTLSSIFIVYKMESIIYMFLLSALIFGSLAFYGYKTKKDISKIGPILLFGLIGVLIASFINLFFIKSESFNLVATIISLIVFVGFVAYDVHIIKRKMYDMDEDKLAVYGAFQLYLDFINIFLDLLSISGKRKD